MKIACFDCFSGIAGDMTLGALVAVGLAPEILKSELSKLNLPGYELSFSKVSKHALTGTKATVKLVSSSPQQPGSHLAEIMELIDKSKIDPRAKEIAKEIFAKLAQAEAKVHNTTKEKIHFHEVGAVDAIVDIVGTAIGVVALGIEEFYSSPLSVGSGFVKTAHGVLPVPAPATLEILKGIPVRQTQIEKELVTPTGAAIIATLVKKFGQLPEMQIEAVGYGAGDYELEEQPDFLRLCVGEKI